MQFLEPALLLGFVLADKHLKVFDNLKTVIIGLLYSSYLLRNSFLLFDYQFVVASSLPDIPCWSLWSRVP